MISLPVFTLQMQFKPYHFHIFHLYVAGAKQGFLSKKWPFMLARRLLFLIGKQNCVNLIAKEVFHERYF
jgi:hypothetical protein